MILKSWKKKNKRCGSPPSTPVPDGPVSKDGKPSGKVAPAGVRSFMVGDGRKTKKGWIDKSVAGLFIDKNRK